MRLINAKKLVKPPYELELIPYELELSGGPGYKPLKYAILSHRWGPEEVTYQELTDAAIFQKRNTWDKSGWKKIQQAARITVDYGYDWLWSDTGCIDKTSSAELTEAINSMFRWYQESSLCLAFLADFPSEGKQTFTESEWFERAWTLQELLAPSKVIFFNKDWVPKFEGSTDGSKLQLADAISKRTRIDKAALLDARTIEQFSVAQRMSWAAGRKATKVEDVAYSLLGIFGVNMPMLYGERTKAFARLQEEIMRRDADQSVFSWFSPKGLNLLAESPADFRDCSSLLFDYGARKPFTVNNLGLDIELDMRMAGFNMYLAPLSVESAGDPGSAMYVLLRLDGQTNELLRIGTMILPKRSNEFGSLTEKTKRVTILRQPTLRDAVPHKALNGFRLARDCLPMTAINNWDPKHLWDRGQWGRWNHETESAHHHPPQSLDQARNPRLSNLDVSKRSMSQFSIDPYGTPIFVIPDRASTSIALLILTLDVKDKFLIQLGFDFDFNPCCHISRMNSDFADRFRERNWNKPEEDKRFTWAFDEFKWTVENRYKEASYHDPSTDRRSWIIKSRNRQEFDRAIPLPVTHPHKGLDVKFSHFNSVTREWEFAIKSTMHDHATLKSFVGDQFAIHDLVLGTRDRDIEVVSP